MESVNVCCNISLTSGIMNDKLVLENVLRHLPDFGWVRLITDGASRSNIVTRCVRVMRDDTSGGFCTFSVWSLRDRTLGQGCLKGCD